MNNNNIKLPFLMCMMLYITLCLTAAAQKRMAPQEIESIEQRYNDGERSIAFMKDYATAMKLKPVKTREEFMSKGSKIENMMQQYYSSLTDDQRLSAECMYFYTDYTSSCSQPTFKFIIENAKHFPETMAENIDSIIDTTLAHDIMGMFSATKTYNTTEVKTLKRLVKERGKAEEYKSVFEFISARGKGDTEKYMKFCKDNLNTLNKAQQISLLGNFSALDKDDDKEQKLQIASFLRNVLPELDVEIIYHTISQIVELEKQ